MWNNKYLIKKLINLIIYFNLCVNAIFVFCLGAGATCDQVPAASLTALQGDTRTSQGKGIT